MNVGDLVIVSKWVVPDLTESERTGVVTKLDTKPNSSLFEELSDEHLYKVQFTHNKLMRSWTWVTRDQIQSVISRTNQKEQK